MGEAIKEGELKTEKREGITAGAMSRRAEGVLTRDTEARDWKTRGQGGRKRSHCRCEIGKSREPMLTLQFHLQNKKVRQLRPREVVTCMITHRE